MSFRRRSWLAGFALALAALIVAGIVRSTSRKVAPLQREPDVRADAEACERASLSDPADAATRTSLDPLTSTLAAPSSTNAAACRIELVDELGAAVRSSPVLLLDADEGVQRASTDDAGRVQFESRAGRGALFVPLTDEAPRRVELDTSPGSHRVQLIAMREVAGIVLEKGLAPVAGLRLFLISHARLYPGIDLPPPVLEFAGLQDGGSWISAHTTKPDGTFAFRGLPESWNGRLILPPTWSLVDEQKTLSGPQVVVVGAPQSNLVISVEHLPHLAGRAVDSDGRPAAQVNIQGLVRWPEGDGSSMSGRSAADGRFEIELDRTQFATLTLDFHGADDRGSAHVVRTRDELGADLDLGDVVLARGSTLMLHVVDAAGRAIAGAVASADTSHTKSTSDVNGDCKVENVPADAKLVRVAAKGFWAAFVDLPVPGPGVRTIALEPCNRLDIAVRGPGGEPVAGVRVQLSAGDQHLFPDTRSDMVDTLVPEKVVGQSLGTRVSGRGNGEARFQTDEHGRVALEGIVPAVALKLRIADQAGQIARELDLAPLGRTEDRHADVALTAVARAVSGIVRDETGSPVPGAQLGMSESRGESVFTKSAADGRFHFGPTFADRIDLGVGKDGFTHVRLHELLLPEPPADIEIVLEHGRHATVMVVDPRSRPVEGGNLSVYDPESSTGWPSVALGPGRYEVGSLPSHEIELRLYLSGKQYAQRFDPRIGQARIEVPAHGRVIATWITDKPGSHTVQLAPFDTSLGTLTSIESDKSDGETVFESVLPGQYTASVVTLALHGRERTSGPDQKINVDADATLRIRVGP